MVGDAGSVKLRCPSVIFTGISWAHDQMVLWCVMSWEKKIIFILLYSIKLTGNSELASLFHLWSFYVYLQEWKYSQTIWNEYGLLANWHSVLFCDTELKLLPCFPYHIKTKDISLVYLVINLKWRLSSALFCINHTKLLINISSNSEICSYVVDVSKIWELCFCKMSLWYTLHSKFTNTC